LPHRSRSRGIWHLSLVQGGRVHRFLRRYRNHAKGEARATGVFGLAAG
jgi:hypothetical protein